MWGRGDAARQAENVSLQHPRISMQEPPRDHETLLVSAPVSI